MILLVRLFYEFAKVGLFAVGGGLATIPFLQQLGETTGWFTDAELSTMIAVSESTPGPWASIWPPMSAFTRRESQGRW